MFNTHQPYPRYHANSWENDGETQTQALASWSLPEQHELLTKVIMEVKTSYRYSNEGFCVDGQEGRDYYS